jgi:hypothetical protein
MTREILAFFAPFFAQAGDNFQAAGTATDGSRGGRKIGKHY